MRADDFVKFFKTSEKYIAHTKMFLNLLREAGVMLTLKKLALVTNTNDYLGHGI